MRNKTLIKGLFALLLVLSLVLTLVPATYAQDEGGAEPATEETVEAAEGADLLTPLGINTGLLLVQTFNFLLMAFILTSVLWRPAVNFLDARSAKIQQGLENAEAASKARQNAEKEAEEIRQDARAEAAKAVEEARQRGEEVAKGIEQSAKQDAERIRNDAEDEAKAARNAELAGLRDEVLNISLALTKVVINKELKADAKKQQQLVEEFFSGVPDKAKNLSGNVEVVSAIELSDAEKKKAEKAISADGYTYTVDPSILGGVIVRTPDAVIDGSARANLDELAERLS